MIGPDNAARALHPRHHALPVDEIPAQNNGRHAQAGIGSASGDQPGRIYRGERVRLFWSKGLPVWNQFNRIFELAAKNTGEGWIGEHFPEPNTSIQKMVAGFSRRSEPAVHENGTVPRVMLHQGVDKISTRDSLGRGGMKSTL